VSFRKVFFLLFGKLRKYFWYVSGEYKLRLMVWRMTGSYKFRVKKLGENFYQKTTDKPPTLNCIEKNFYSYLYQITKISWLNLYPVNNINLFFPKEILFLLIDMSFEWNLINHVIYVLIFGLNLIDGNFRWFLWALFLILENDEDNLSVSILHETVNKAMMKPLKFGS
jgi:hypothetical protein